MGCFFFQAEDGIRVYDVTGVQTCALPISIVERLLLTVRGGWGFRDYRRFEFEPSRNEHVWQLGAELRKRFNEHVSVALVIDYDYFDSKNVLFAAERYVGGVVFRFEN